MEEKLVNLISDYKYIYKHLLFTQVSSININDSSSYLIRYSTTEFQEVGVYSNYLTPINDLNEIKNKQTLIAYLKLKNIVDKELSYNIREIFFSDDQEVIKIIRAELCTQYDNYKPSNMLENPVATHNSKYSRRDSHTCPNLHRNIMFIMVGCIGLILIAFICKTLINFVNK